MIRKLENVAGLPAPNGHYAHATQFGNLMFVSGQLGRGPQLSDEAAGGIEVQTRRSLAGIAAILAAAGSDWSRVLKTTVYVTSIDNWPAVNAVYAEVLGAHKPARAIVPVPELHFGALIEIDAIAVHG